MCVSLTVSKPSLVSLVTCRWWERKGMETRNFILHWWRVDLYIEHFAIDERHVDMCTAITTSAVCSAKLVV